MSVRWARSRGGAACGSRSSDTGAASPTSPARWGEATRRLGIGYAILCALSGCSGLPARYLADGRFRRVALEASLTSRDNRYARVRLSRYGGGREWDRLPELNPRVEPVTARELEAPDGAPLEGALGATARALAVETAGAGATSVDKDALRRLGAEAFFRYPAQLAGYASRALRSRAEAAAYGLWIDDTRGVGGLVHVALPGGGSSLALTCATCHVRQVGGRLSVGAGSDRLDLGRLIYDEGVAREGSAKEALRRWGPGRADVSTEEGELPVRIPDLRAVRFVTHLQHDGTVIQRDLASLAIRIETLLITGHGGALRPPRAVALGLAVFLWSLGDELARAAPATREERRGATLFAARCAGCHAPPGFAGPPVPLEVVGTDPAAGRSTERGTGGYRVPSLRGVSSRGPLLHDGAVAGLEALFDPARIVPGHRFGLDLDAGARAALVSYLNLL